MNFFSLTTEAVTEHLTAFAKSPKRIHAADLFPFRVISEKKPRCMRGLTKRREILQCLWTQIYSTRLRFFQRCMRNGEYDCCGGKRKGREGDGKLRAFLSRGFYKICEALTGLNTNDGEGDFRMMNRQVMDAILSLHERGRYTKGIFSFVGFRTKWIEFENVERKTGESKWNLRALLRYAADGILAFSTAPLRLAGALAALLAAAAAAALICTALTGSPRGIETALILGCGTLQMLVLYIFGLYFAHAYKEIKARPVYIVRERG